MIYIVIVVFLMLLFFLIRSFYTRNYRKSVNIYEDFAETSLLSRSLSLLHEGIVVMDPHGRIMYMNKFARDVFGVSEEPRRKFFYEVIRDFDIVSFINENFNEKYRILQEKKIGNRFIQVVFGSDADEKVLLLHDLTHIKKYENLKKDFIANVSHEFKTPVATLKLILETLEDECKDNKQTLAFIKKAIGRVDYMEQLIEDLTTLSMLDSSKVKLAVTEIKLKPFFENLCREFIDMARLRDIKLNVNIPDVSIKTDEKLFYSIFKNLIDNAIKYNIRAGAVTVSYKELPAEYVISVCDTGTGIPKSHLPFIFERFYRVDRSRSKKLGGTGLGLSIVQLASRRLGGKVEVESKVGEGTCFDVCIPKG